MVDAHARKASTKAPPKALVTSKIPTKLPLRVSAAVPKAGVSSKTSLPATNVLSRARGEKSKVSKAPPTESEVKKALPTSPLPKHLGKLPPQVESSAAKEAQHPSTIPEAPDELLLLHEPSDVASDGSVHLATYDDVLSPIETPREISVTCHDGKETLWDKRELLLHKLNEEKEDCSSEAKELEEEETVSLLPVATRFLDPIQNAPEDEGGEKSELRSDNGEKEVLISVKNPQQSEENEGDIAFQLFKAEEHVGQLNREVSRLRETLYHTENPLFIQHAFQLERDVERLRHELERERASTKYYRDAHAAVFVERGMLCEEMDHCGTHSSLLKRNAELEARLDDMAKEKVERELLIGRLQETATLGTLHGNSSFGSGYVTVRLSGLCELCQEKLKNEAGRRAVRDRVAHLAEPKSIGIISPSPSEPWSSELMKQLQRRPEEISPQLDITAVGCCDHKKKSNIQPHHGVLKTPDELINENNVTTRVTNEPLINSEEFKDESSMWRKLQSPDGRTIYYNILTNLSTFDCPEALGG